MPKRVAIEVSLPVNLRAWIEEQVDRGDFSSMDECIAHAVRKARMVSSKSEVERILLERIDGPRGRAMKPHDWDRLIAGVRDRAARRVARARRTA